MTDLRENPDRPKGTKMLGVLEARAHLCAVPRQHGDSKASWLRRAAAAFGLTFWQAKKIYYGEAKRIDADRLDAMRATIASLQERAATRRETLHDLEIRLAEIRSGSGGGSAA